MAKASESLCKICRRMGDKIMLKGERCLTKCAMERRGTGRPQRRRKVSDRGLQLLEKQRARYTYGILERQFRRIFEEAARQPGITGDNLQVLLERRLDNTIYLLGFAESRSQARQLVLHGHLKVNGTIVNIPSYLVKEGDSITWREGSTRTEYYKTLVEQIKGKVVPSWLSLNRENLTGQVVSLPKPDQASAKVDGKVIVEYYSR